MAGRTTNKPSVILEFIKQKNREKGYPPSVREICQGVGLKSTSTVHAHLARLEAQGYIRRDPTKPRAIEIIDDPRRNYIDVPIVGKVTAGQPILAMQNNEGTIPVPDYIIKGSESFILRVEGESMINAGIFDGDMVIVRRQSDAKNGDIVVAMIDDEATVKRFYQEGKFVRLQPENTFMQPIYSDHVVILGLVVGLFRAF